MHFELQGDLALLTDADSLKLAVATRETIEEAYGIYREHERHFPSTAWFAVSTLSGLGGLLLLEPTTGSMIITIGGALGAAKSSTTGVRVSSGNRDISDCIGVRTATDALSPRK